MEIYAYFIHKKEYYIGWLMETGCLKSHSPPPCFYFLFSADTALT